MNKVLVIVAVLLLALAGNAGEIFQWVDERGVVHFTDNSAAVPAKYRKRMDRRDLPEATGASAESTLRSKPVVEEPRDRHGRGKGYWVNRKNEIEARLYRAEGEYKRLRSEYGALVDSYRNTSSIADRDTYRKQMEKLEVELRRQREDIRNTRELLEKTLPQEAARAQAPPKWLE
jgi:hypothetical protein